MSGKPSSRCGWCTADPLYIAYHDEEWGVPVHDERHLFEMLCLEGAQAGLSWIIVLKKRENYRRAFAGFDPEKVVRFNSRKLKRLLADPGLIRNRGKLESVIQNAHAVLKLYEQGVSLADFLWQFVDYHPRQNRWRNYRLVPAQTKESEAMSRALKKCGFNFVGPTICYAFMQAVGMVNDHELTCPRHREISRLPD
ncbi:MAG TPA: DNA-3-methyladenine glycosylase I [Gammaproteobacteria bacterium]|nr:DNA-3-methyladenine glycosylase I [Gammaproteobacteria bacterium]